ncbi:hypothetical protein ACJX0J_034875, partial [Zea mays]
CLMYLAFYLSIAIVFIIENLGVPNSPLKRGQMTIFDFFLSRTRVNIEVSFSNLNFMWIYFFYKS